MSDKLGRCPNRECKRSTPETCDDWTGVYVECCGCEMRGPAVEFDEDWEDERQDAAYAEAVRLWNLLPRDAEPAGVLNGEL